MSDKHLVPVFNPNAEAHAMQALNALMMMLQTAQRAVGPEQIVELRDGLARLVDSLFPIQGNTADFAGYAPLPTGHYVHPVKTAEAAALLGRATGMPRSKLIVLAKAAALMNVGYVQLRQSLIEEPRRLLEGEWEQQMHTHPAHSVAVLTSSGLPHEAIVAIGQHHERWDGSGYPHGARGNDICVEARILGIADSFISMRSNRPHRAAMTTEQALEVIRAESGALYEPGLVDAFVDVIDTYAEKEERRAESASSTAGTASEEAGAPHEQQAPKPVEDFAPARRDDDQRAADDRVAATARTTTPRQPVRPSLAPVAPVPCAASTATPVTLPADTHRRRRTPVRAASAVSIRRSLFSTDVYLRGSSGRWI